MRLNLKKPRPGLYKNIPFERYCKIVALNQSTLKPMLVSPLHYKICMEKEKDTADMTFGRAFHTRILEPRKFPKQWTVYPGAVRRGKEWETFKEVNAGRSILTGAEYDELERLANCVKRHPLSDCLHPGGVIEGTFIWIEEVDNHRITCKARLDYCLLAETADRRPQTSDRTKCVVDLKTTRTVERVPFEREAAKYGYHIQAAFYRRAVEAVTGWRLNPDAIKFLCVEKETGAVARYTLPTEALIAGQHAYEDALRAFAKCSTERRWPGPNDDREEELITFYPPTYGTKVLDMSGLEPEPEMEDVAA